jgi:hypothetical protein
MLVLIPTAESNISFWSPLAVFTMMLTPSPEYQFSTEVGHILLMERSICFEICLRLQQEQCLA